MAVAPEHRPAGSTHQPPHTWIRRAGRAVGNLTDAARLIIAGVASLAVIGAVSLAVANATDSGGAAAGPAGWDRQGNRAIWRVDTAAKLAFALARVGPGDVISMAPGRYEGAFYTIRSGRPDAPITLSGPRGAVLSNSHGYCDPYVPSVPSGITYCGYGLHLNGANYWRLTGFTVTDSSKGIVLDRSNYNVISNVEIQHVNAEAVRLRASSSGNVLRQAYIHDTGQTQPGFGEGLYIGSARGDWEKFGTAGGAGPDRSNGNAAVGNRFGPNVTAEHIDIKEGTSGGLVYNNVFDGRGLSGVNSGDSWVDLKGNNYRLTSNRGTYSYPGGGQEHLTDGYQVHQVLAPYGCGNVFRGNLSDLGGVGRYAIYVRYPDRCRTNPNVVYASNRVVNATEGLTNIAVTAG